MHVNETPAIGIVGACLVLGSDSLISLHLRYLPFEAGSLLGFGCLGLAEFHRLDYLFGVPEALVIILK